MRSVTAADLFCGAGGTSTGLAQACHAAGLGVDLLAVNHWNVAIETHTSNHPWARHLCESLDNVDPRKVIPSGRLNLLVASPECTHHSNARGGKPMSDQSRSSAWHILRWAEALYIENILVENVREFVNWGPLGADCRPLKSKRGETFKVFIDGLRSLNYDVDYRELVAADYGDPTTRKRLFVMARKRPRKVRWPEPSHRPAGSQPGLFSGTRPWRTAREIIDWSIPGESIFTRKRPLAKTTLARIAAGFRKFGGLSAEPFLVILRNHGEGRSIDSPVPTVTAGGNHFGLVEPFLIGAGGPAYGGKPRSIDKPMGTVMTANHTALIEPFIVPLNHGASDQRSYPMDRPMPTITTLDAWGMVEPFLVKYYGTSDAEPVGEPLDTITAKDRFGLVTPAGLDIRFRMLQPHELARAMSFPDGYAFSGNREVKVKQIGNAVPVGLARALCSALISDYAKAERDAA